MAAILLWVEGNDRPRRARSRATFDRPAAARFRDLAAFHNILQVPYDGATVARRNTSRERRRPHAAEADARPSMPAAAAGRGVSRGADAAR
ncbi:hypothetical protein BLAT2472_70148 [Burkholderia latens]